MTDTNVSGRHINSGTYVTVKRCHERLAKTHYFALRTAFGIEIRASLAAA